MNTQRNVLLLVGSAKQPGRSTSESLGGYLGRRIATHGWGMQTLYVHQALRTAARTRVLLKAADTADLIVLASPLYVDSLPYLVTAALERIAAHRTGATSQPAGRFMALINCGFPEAAHNDVALAICRQFARSAMLEWAGGLSMGEGGVIHGLSLDERGGIAASVRHALDLTADALAVGLPIPQEAVEILAKPLIPTRLYTTIGNLGWRQTGWKQGTYRHLPRPALRMTASGRGCADPHGEG